MCKNFDAVIFDFDGTVADTGKGIFGSIRYALNACSLPQLDEKSLRTFIGPPLHDSFKRECGADDEMCVKLVAKYRENYAVKGIFEFELYPGMEELLKKLKAEGIVTGIASSKPEDFINIILNNTRLNKYFDFTSGSDPRYVESDKTEIVKKCIRKMKLPENSKILMVGDRLYDIVGAHNAGIKCAAVLFGYGNPEEFKKYKAEYIAKDVNELKNIIFG